MKMFRRPSPLRCTILGLAASFAFASTALAADGKAIYEKYCKTCHGDDGTSDTKAGKMTESPNLKTAEWTQGKTVEAVATKTLTAKIGKMPSFEKKLTEEERNAVAAFVIDLVK
jgi:mono/diheme cytochrome c family protein